MRPNLTRCAVSKTGISVRMPLRGFPSGAARIFIRRSPALGRRGNNTLRLLSLCARMDVRHAPESGSLPFPSVPFRPDRGLDHRRRWISLIVSRRMARSGSSTRPLYPAASPLSDDIRASSCTIPSQDVRVRSRIESIDISRSGQFSAVNAHIIYKHVNV